MPFMIAEEPSISRPSPSSPEASIQTLQMALPIQLSDSVEVAPGVFLTGRLLAGGTHDITHISEATLVQQSDSVAVLLMLISLDQEGTGGGR